MAAGLLTIAVFFALSATAQEAPGAQPSAANDTALDDVVAALADVAAARACASISSDGDRLACYDRALRRTTAAVDSPSEVARPRASAAPSPSGPSERARTGADEVPQLQVRVPRAAATATTTRPSADSAANGSDDEPEQRLVTVIEIRTRMPNDALFVADDGSVWQQIDSRRFRAPNVPFEAQIRPGAFGSFFLVPTGRGPAVRVRQQ